MCRFIFYILSCMTIIPSVCALKQAVFHDVEALAGYNITSSILDVITKYERTTKTTCTLECLALENCLSFFYNSITHQCQLHTEVFHDNTGASIQSGAVYFYSTTTRPHCPTEDGFQVVGSYPDEMCIKFHTDEKNWSDANATCANYSTTGQLAVLDTADKDNLTRNAGIAMNSEFSARVYFGITTAGWIDGSPLVYSNWRSGSLYSLGAGECAAYDRINGWVWIGIDCSNEKHYVCQVPL